MSIGFVPPLTLPVWIVIVFAFLTGVAAREAIRLIVQIVAGMVMVWRWAWSNWIHGRLLQ